METCKTCKYYEGSQAFEDYEGECRRYPPKIYMGEYKDRKGEENIYFRSYSVAIDGGRWCGEWKTNRKVNMDIKKVYILNENTLLQVRAGLDLDYMPRIISPSNLSRMIKNPEYEVGEAKDLSRNRLLEAAKDRRLLWIDPNDESKGGDMR